MSQQKYELKLSSMDVVTTNVISPSAISSTVLQAQVPKNQVWEINPHAGFRLAVALKKQVITQTLTSGTAFTLSLDAAPFVKPGSARFQGTQYAARLFTFADGGTPTPGTNEVASSRITFNYDTTNTLVFTPNASEAGGTKTVVAYYKFGLGEIYIAREQAGDETVEDKLKIWSIYELHSIDFDKVTNANTLPQRKFNGGDKFQVKVKSSVQIDAFNTYLAGVWELNIPIFITTT